MDDRYIRVLLSQNYGEYTKVLVGEIDKLFHEESTGHDIVDDKFFYVEPNTDYKLTSLPRFLNK